MNNSNIDDSNIQSQFKMLDLSEKKKWLYKKYICFFCNNEISDDNPVYMGKGYAFCTFSCRHRMIKLLD